MGQQNVETLALRMALAAEAAAKRTVLDPVGNFGLDLVTGVMAAGLAANSEIFQWRWTDATRFCAIRSVSLFAGSIVAFAAGAFQFELVPARGFTVDGTGGATATITTNNGKLRTNYGTTLLTSAPRIATTQALGVGTKTLDAQGIGMIGGSVPAVAGNPLVSPAAELKRAAGFPLILAANEGFVIRATVPATGTWTGGVNVEWDEVNTY